MTHGTKKGDHSFHGIDLPRIDSGKSDQQNRNVPITDDAPHPTNTSSRTIIWRVILRTEQEKFGAGEGIRTLDPNLGKVVLYH